MNLSVYFYFWGGDDRDIFVLPFVVNLPSDSISPLFYIRLSYVAIKDDFCKKNTLPHFHVYSLSTGRDAALLNPLPPHISSPTFLLFVFFSLYSPSNIRRREFADTVERSGSVFLIDSSKAESVCFVLCRGSNINLSIQMNFQTFALFFFCLFKLSESELDRWLRAQVEKTSESLVLLDICAFSTITTT